MNLSLLFARLFFMLISIVFMATYTLSAEPTFSYEALILGIVYGVVLGFILILIDMIFRRFSLRMFNVAIIGLFIGFFMGEALLLVLKGVMSLTPYNTDTRAFEVAKIFLYLLGTYLGVIMTLKAADELYVSIPFIKFSPATMKKRDMLIDASALRDVRLIDLTSSGILDQHVILARFVVKEIYAQAESADENVRAKAKKSLEVIRKLEENPYLELRYSDNDFPEIKEINEKLFRLARLLECNVLTADVSKVQQSTVDGIRLVNLHSLANALKPISQTGEHLRIKIQRYGKEARQGVGYLEDGTMVVVNGGGQYLGETIDVRVLSVKHTSSGRMIFCNAEDHVYEEDDIDEDDYN